jgi:hypothetical protein
MQLKEYKPAGPPIWAVQWFKNDSTDVLAWLTEVKCSYSYHEINSGGELIIYTSNGPVQINDGDYIVQSGYEFNKMNTDLFKQTYEEV